MSNLNLTIQDLKIENIGDIENIVLAYEFNDYRHYRMLPKTMRGAYLLKQVEGLLIEDNNHILIAMNQGEVVGLVCVSFLPWMNDIFNKKMAEVKYLILSGTYKEKVCMARKLLLSAQEICQENDIAFLSCRMDVSDVANLHVMQELDFQIMDTLVTHLFNRSKHNLLSLKKLYDVRQVQQEDLSELQVLVENRLFDTRFGRDPHFKKENINVMYQKWIRTYFSDWTSMKGFAVERKNKLGGFIIVRQNQDFEKFSGLKMFGRGLSVIDHRFKGAYPQLIQTALEYHIEMKYDLCEFDAKIDNYEVLRIWQAFGLNLVRAKHTFHKWL